MIQEEVYAIPLVTDADAFLSCHEGEARTQLQKETLQVTDNRVLKVGLAVLILEIEELQNIRIPDFFLKAHHIIQLSPFTTFQHEVLLF